MRKRMNVKAKRTALALGGAASALLLAGVLFAPADATPSGEWVLGYTDSTTGTPHFAAPGDVIVSSNLNLSFTGSYKGSPATVNCVNVATTDFKYTVPNPVPSGPTNGTIQIQLDTPPGTLTGCINDVDNGPVDVEFDQGADSKWTLDIDLPTYNGSATGQAHMTPVLTGRITVPTGDPSGYGNGSVVATATTLYNGATPTETQPCIIQGPAWFDMTVDGEYDPSSGIASKTGLPKDFLLDTTVLPTGYPPLTGTPTSQANCPAVAVDAHLQSASVELAEEDNGYIPTAVWQN